MINNTNDNSQDNSQKDDFVIGRHPVTAALKNKDEDINKLFMQDSINKNDEHIKEIMRLAKKRGIVTSIVPKQKLDLLSHHQNHQGLVAGIAAFNYATIEDLFENAKKKKQEPFFIILDNIEDPHNLGSILRTADAAGVTGVIIPKHHSVGLTSTVAKTSTGAFEHVPVAKVTNLVNTIKDLKKKGVWVFGTDMKGKDYRTWNAQGPTALIIGNEGKGISPLLKKQVDEMLTIPMVPDSVQSLNASVAAGLLMYQGFNSRNPLN